MNSHNAEPNIFCAKQAFEGGLLGWDAHIGRETCGTVVLAHGGREACWVGMLPLNKDRGKGEQKPQVSYSSSMEFDSPQAISSDGLESPPVW